VDLPELQRNWDTLAKQDPMWAIMTEPSRHGGAWDVAEFFASGQAHVAEALAAVERATGSVPTGRALDFGCGLGRLTEALGDRFDEVDGVDIAPSMIEGARSHSRHAGRVRYHVNERDDLALFEDATFDLVLSIIVLQHMENRFAEQYLREFVRVLRPGGVAVFTVPSHPALTPRGIVFALVPNGLLNRYRRRRYGYGGVIELHGLRRKRVEEVLTTAGATLAAVEPEPMLGNDWHSFRYVAVRAS